MMGLILELAKERKNNIDFGWFGYTKEKGRTIAPCGQVRRCKNNHRKCKCWEEPDICERPFTVYEKADYRLWCESTLNGWTIYNKPPKLRIRQILKAFENRYRKTAPYCKGCELPYCSVNDIQHPDCKLYGLLCRLNGLKE